ncbi:DEAD/DEAH box helicase family protein [Thalassotalea hakodatensis]|uniref:DEAD/DEAH box helicase family protein n=1 Tax=Thalassotalea hakodatensis TaxID=3030492 RepID=UPI00257236F7|nr:DEAD/DEAH box helicase family protein [Thalassotalea hakodatensis]
MGLCELVSVSCTEGGNYRKINGQKHPETPKAGEHVVRHYLINNFIEDLPKVLTKLFESPREVLLTWPSKISNNKTICNRSKVLLGTDYSHSTIGIIDIDEIDGEPIENDGSPVEQQVNKILEKHLPREILLASRVVKMSSSWYTDQKIKFHVYFKLAEPVTHGSWAEFCQVNIPIADKALINNSAQIAFSSRPKGVNSDIEIFTFEGDELFVDKKVYKAPHKIKRNPASDLTHNINLKSGEITKKSLGVKLDMSFDSHNKSFAAFREAIANGYNPDVLTDMIAQMHDRGGKVSSRVGLQSEAALKNVIERCTDSFFGIKEELLANSEYVEFSNLIENKDGKTINLVKGTTGIGKTQAMTDFCKERSVVVIGQTRLLVHQNADDFKAYPVDQEVNCGADLSSHNSISTTIHSIYKLSDTIYNKAFDVLFIDEAAQTLKSWIDLGEEERVKTKEAVSLLIEKTPIIVFADADMTETTIQGYEKLLGVEFNCNSRNVTKQDFESREAHLYETKGEVLTELQKSLDKGKRCLAIVDNKDYLHEIAEKRLNATNAFFFSRDTEEEVSHVKFREKPKEFVKDIQLLFCSPLLKSGVSFVNVFEEVFIIIDGDSFTSRDIIQMLSRERRWKKVHIYTNTKSLAINKPVDNPSVFDEALVMVNEDIRQQLFVRPFDTAYRLERRGATVTFVHCNHAKLQGGNIAVQEYKAENQDGRSAYEKYVFKLINGKKLTQVQNIVTKHEALRKRKGFDKAIQCPLRFFDWVQDNQALKKEMGTQFRRFSKSLEQAGIGDCGFFIGANFTNKTRPKQPKKLKEALNGYSLGFEGYSKANEQLRNHNRVMAAIDEDPQRVQVEEDILDICDVLEEVIDI